MALINCPRCGKQISDKSETCVNCGYSLTKPTCIRCGAPYPPDVRFCPKDGGEVIQFNAGQKNEHDQTYRKTNRQGNNSDKYIQYTDANPESDRNATTSLVIGISSLFAWFVPLIGFTVSIAGIITGNISYSKTKSGRAVVGIILSIIGLILTFINSLTGIVLWNQIFSNQFH